VAGILFSVLAQVREYASGPARRTTADGTVSQIAVVAGQKVAAGDLLVRFYGAREAAELARIDREMELQLVNRLRDPSDAGAEQALTSLRAQRELARSNVSEREVRAATAGVVGDLRVRVGQRILPGQTLLSLARGMGGAGNRPQVVALLPGEYRPLLKPGMPLRLELQGYRYAYQHLVVDAVGDEVVGPEEAQRYLGEDVAGGVAITGPVVRVEAHLTSGTFESEGHLRRYHDGMWGKAEVRVRSERVLVALIPALKAVFEPREAGDA
jgi:biotin carboxyl carrier protein